MLRRPSHLLRWLFSRSGSVLGAGPTSAAPDGIISVDRAGLLGLRAPAAAAAPPAGAAPPPAFERPSALTPALRSLIADRGALSLAEWWRGAAGHPQHGYYTRAAAPARAFGARGDFTTAVELSPLFGEALAVWAVAAWQTLGCPAAFALLELGPGRGTLAAALLAAAPRFPRFAAALAELHLVETSRPMRAAQAAAIGAARGGGGDSGSDDDDAAAEWTRGVVQLAGRGAVAVRWHDSVEDAAAAGAQPVLAFAHELFDALPVHQFEWVGDAWRERLVQVHPALQAGGGGGGAAAAALDAGAGAGAPHLVLVTAPGATPASLGFSAAVGNAAGAAAGDVAEWSPAAAGVVAALAAALAARGGAALIIDYGYSARQPHASARDSVAAAATPLPPLLPAARAPTVRAIRAHAFVEPLATPGDADLSADVDFDALARAARARGAAVAGPVTQAALLAALGLHARAARLTAAAGGAAAAARIAADVRRLTDDSDAPDAMGRVYKALALLRAVPGTVLPANGAALAEAERDASAHLAEQLPGFERGDEAVAVAAAPPPPL